MERRKMQVEAAEGQDGSVGMIVQEVRAQDMVLEAARQVHRRLGKRRPVEEYEAALSEELRSRGIGVRERRNTRILFGGLTAGVYLADLFIDGETLIEIKRAERLTEEEKTSFGEFIREISCQRGYLLNFAADDLEVATFAAK